MNLTIMRSKIALYEKILDNVTPEFLTNPDIVKEAFQSGGSNLLNGLKNFADDLDLKPVALICEWLIK